MPHDQIIREGLESGWDVEPLAGEQSAALRAYIHELEQQPSIFAVVKVTDVVTRLYEITEAS